VINKFYLLCVIFSGSPDLTLKTCLVPWISPQREEFVTYLGAYYFLKKGSVPGSGIG